jgi:hypothetical protein
MRPVRNVFQKLSRTEQKREGVVAYLCAALSSPPPFGGRLVQLGEHPARPDNSLSSAV